MKIPNFPKTKEIHAKRFASYLNSPLDSSKNHNVTTLC